MASTSALPSADVARAFARLATNVAIVTVADRDGLHGCTANAWAEAVDPPLLLVTLKRTGETRSRIVAARRFAANVLAADDERLALAFARKGDRFASVEHTAGPALAQPLLDGALSAIESELVQTVPFGAYDILVGRAASVRLSDADAAPLVHYEGRFLLSGNRQDACATDSG